MQLVFYLNIPQLCKHVNFIILAKNDSVELMLTMTVDSGIATKGLYLLDPHPPTHTSLHFCLKVAVELHVRFPFGLKS